MLAAFISQKASVLSCGAEFCIAAVASLAAYLCHLARRQQCIDITHPCTTLNDMFCADWALIFGFGGVALHQLRDAEYSDDALLAAPAPAALGAASGAFAALVLYPLDFVRQTATAAPGTAGRPVFAWSSIPFGACAFGLFLRLGGAEAPLGDRAARALGVSAVALAVELPLDQAKIALAGGLRNAALVTTLRWPFSAALLLAFETAAARPRLS